MNVWRDLPSGFDFLDVGLRFKDVAELARVLMFVPGCINRDDVSDLWAVMRYGEVLKIVFIEVVFPGPGSAEAYLIEQDGQPWLTMHRIDVARDLSFETVYSPDGDGTIITFEEQFCNCLRAAVNGCDGYDRFRIDLQGAASCMFTVETHSQHGHLAPATDVTETTEFGLNVVRSYPEVVAHRARVGRFSIEKVHYLLIRDVGRRLVAQHGGVRNVRRFILTDPPYATNYCDRQGRSVRNDNNGRWLEPAFAEMHRVLKDGGFAVSFYGWDKVDLFMEAWRAAGFRIVGHLVFRKRYASSSRFLRDEHEQAYLLTKGNPTMPPRVIPDVIDFPYSGNRLYPTQRPVEALRPLVGAFSRPGELVLDPFSGSGSTLAAAQMLGRDWVGIEVDNNHYHTATRRVAEADRRAPA